MKNQTISDALNIGYLSQTSDLRINKILHSIVNISSESSVYIHDDFIATYSQLGPLHFDFLPPPLILSYNTGVIVWEGIVKPLILRSQCVLIDFGVYHVQSATTDAFDPFLVGATKYYQKPTVYIVHGVEEQINMEIIKSKAKLEQSDILMVYDKESPNSLKRILHKLVEIAT